jgi:hypothetical protein
MFTKCTHERKRHCNLGKLCRGVKVLIDNCPIPLINSVITLTTHTNINAISSVLNMCGDNIC